MQVKNATASWWVQPKMSKCNKELRRPSEDYSRKRANVIKKCNGFINIPPEHVQMQQKDGSAK